MHAAPLKERSALRRSINMNNTNRSLRGFLFPLITLISGLILALVTGYLYLNRIDVLDVDGIYKTILLKNDGTRWILPLLFAAFLTVLAVFCPLFVKKKQTLPEKRDSIPLLFARCLAGAAAIATLIMGFVLSREGTPYVIEYLGSVREVPSFLVSLYEMGVPIPAEAQPLRAR